MPIQPRPFLRSLFAAAVRAADPAVCLPPHLPPPPRGRTLAVGAGKAAAAMARAVEDHWEGELDGLVVTRYGHGLSQADLAARMRTTRSAVSRLESGAHHRPSLTTIENYARAVGCRVELHITPGR